MEKVTRRGAIAGGLGLTMTALLSDFAQGAEESPLQQKCWTYTKLCPKKVAKAAYESYAADGCLSGAFKGGLLEYAAAIEASDPATAAAVRAFPFFVLRAGRGGFGKLKQLCGAIAGGVMFFSCFIEDFPTVCQLSEKLGKWAAETALPEFVPEDDQHPDFLKVVAGGITCREMGAAWMGAATDEQKKIVLERCKRHTASIMGKAVELLNAHFEEK